MLYIQIRRKNLQGLFIKQTFKTKYIQHVSGTLTILKQVQFRYVKENTPQNYQDCVSLCSQNHVFTFGGKEQLVDSDTKHMIKMDTVECVYKTYL